MKKGETTAFLLVRNASGEQILASYCVIHAEEKNTFQERRWASAYACSEKCTNLWTDARKNHLHKLYVQITELKYVQTSEQKYAQILEEKKMNGENTHFGVCEGTRCTRHPLRLDGQNFGILTDATSNTKFY